MGRQDLRCFVAAEIDGAVKRRLHREIGFLQLAGASVKWVPKENMHLTVRFIGDVRPDEVIGLCDAVGGACEGLSPARLVVRSVHTLPPGKPRPRVIAAGIEGETAPLDELFKRLQSALARQGFRPERKGFRPHVTLGRVRDARGLDDLMERIAQARGREFGVVRVQRVHLMMSDLMPEGAVYTSMKEFAFGP